MYKIVTQRTAVEEKDYHLVLQDRKRQVGETAPGGATQGASSTERSIGTTK